ncbi:hypothetical protein [Microbacterium resistens]|uniref:hypothetical protein n=1 Tax=Microbacterium resistens TaxID=156977 RepID=UPI000ADEB088|nr:hypothetical protein [Microbacterium resistens]
MSFFALAIAGLGFLSLFTETDLIVVAGLGQLPGIVGMVLAVTVFAVVLRIVLRPPRPSFVPSVFLALGTTLAHLAGVWIAALVEGAGIAPATAAVGQLVLGGASAVIAVAALVAAWGGIALRRTRSGRPRWPWEE